MTRFRSPVTFGSADGLTVAIGIVISLTGQPHALVRAALGAAVAELVGMSSGAWLSDEKAGFGPALANGGSAFAACIAPALPYAVLSGSAAAGVSVLIVVLAASAIALLRPERGLLAWAQTFAVLGAAAGLCFAASLI